MPFEERKQAWEELYTGKRRRLAMIYFNETERPWPYPELKKERIAWALQVYRVQRDRAEWLKDDRVPFLAPYTGTEIFARAFGCKVHLPGDNMPFALPRVVCAAEAAKLRTPDPESALAEIWEIAEALHQAEPDAVLALPDIQSPLDIAALVWEKTDFYAAMLEAPEAVLELTEKAFALLTGFLDRWFARYGRAFISHYPDYYMPFGVTLSEDEVGVIGAELFDRFCLPSLNALSNRYGGRIGVHCCADSAHQWQGFRKIEGLTVLNLVQPEDVLRRAYPFFGGTCAQMHSVRNVDDRGSLCLPDNAEELRLVLQAWADGRDDALRKLETLKLER
jgi:hypothetical protein